MEDSPRSGDRVISLSGHLDTSKLFDLLVERVVEYAILLLDADGKIASWNPGAQRIKGYTAGEIVGQPYAVFFSEEDRLAGRPEHILGLAREAGQFQEEAWRIRKDGRRFWASMLLTALRDQSGRFVGYAKITRDLSERLAAAEEARRAAAERAARQQAETYEAAMRRSRDELELILRSIGEAVTVLGANGEFVFVNDIAARLCGFDSAAEMLATPSRQILQRFEMLREDGTRLEVDELPGQMALRGRSSSTVVRFKMRDTGEERWSFVSAAPVVDTNGKIEHAVTVFREFTDRRRAEESWQFLAEASAVLASSLDYEATLARVADVAVPRIADWCSVDVLESNSALRSLATAHVASETLARAREWRRRSPPAPGSAVWRVIESRKAELIPEITDDIIDASTTDVEGRRLARELGLRSALVVPLTVANQPFGAITFITAASGRIYRPDDLIMAAEIGHRASLAIENARAYQEARAAVSARDNFLSIASHELRTPLSALTILTTSLVRVANSGRLMQLGEEHLTQRILMAERQTKQLGALVTRLLDVRRLTSTDMELDLALVDLADVVRDAVARLELPEAATNPVEVSVRGSFVGRWDRQRLDQVFTNLLSNAVKYAPRAPVSVVVEAAGSDQVRVSVKDQGPGIAPEHHERIFRQFERVGADGVPGMGLGLWIVARIVKAHGGTVALDSRPGAGACFHVVLPLPGPASPSSESCNVDVSVA